MSEQRQRYTAVNTANFLSTEYWSTPDNTLSDELETAITTANDLTLSSKEAIIPLSNLLINQLESEGIIVTEAYFIRHLQDKTAEETESGEVITVPKKPHMHMVIVSDKRHDISLWSKALGMKEHMVQKVKQGRFSKLNVLSYLIHIKYPSKTQYQPNDVYTARGMDYLEIYNDNKEQWSKGKALVQKKNIVTEEALAELTESILNGNITMEDILLSDDYMRVYSYNRHQVQSAIATYGEATAIKDAKSLEDGDFSTTIIYMHGLTGSGKSHFAKQLCKKLEYWSQNNYPKRWRTFKGSSRNPIEGWAGEEIILLDDVHASGMDLSSWLQLLDPHNQADLYARYHNVKGIAPRVIIITSTLAPINFFYYMKNRGAEQNISQCLRRIHLTLEFIREETSLSVAPTNKNTRCIMRLPKNHLKEVEVVIKEYDDKKPKHYDVNKSYNPFLEQMGWEEISTKVSITFERPTNLPAYLHPFDCIEAVTKQVATNCNIKYELSEETQRSLKKQIYMEVFEMANYVQKLGKPAINPFI